MQSVNQQDFYSVAGRRETLSELVRRHMNDESHSTTEEELRNVLLDIPEARNAEVSKKTAERVKMKAR